MLSKRAIIFSISEWFSIALGNPNVLPFFFGYISLFYLQHFRSQVRFLPPKRMIEFWFTNQDTGVLEVKLSKRVKRVVQLVGGHFFLGHHIFLPYFLLLKESFLPQQDSCTSVSFISIQVKEKVQLKASKHKKCTIVAGIGSQRGQFKSAMWGRARILRSWGVGLRKIPKQLHITSYQNAETRVLNHF